MIFNVSLVKRGEMKHDRKYKKSDILVKKVIQIS